MNKVSASRVHKGGATPCIGWISDGLVPWQRMAAAQLTVSVGVPVGLAWGYSQPEYLSCVQPSSAYSRDHHPATMMRISYFTNWRGDDAPPVTLVLGSGKAPSRDNRRSEQLAIVAAEIPHVAVTVPTSEQKVLFAYCRSGSSGGRHHRPQFS
jgi:hypothetical protein